MKVLKTLGKLGIIIFGICVAVFLLGLGYLILGLIGTVAVEILGIIVLVFVFVSWLIFLAIYTWYLRVSYDPDNDTSRKGEVKGRPDSPTVPATINVARKGRSEQRELLPSKIAMGIPSDQRNDGETSSSVRTPGNRLRKLLKRK